MMVQRALFALRLVLVGCSGECEGVPPLAEGVDRFVVVGVAEQDSALVLSDTLRGEFRFVTQGVLKATSGSYDGCYSPGMNVEGVPIRAEFALDTTIVADGEPVPAGTDLVPYLRDGDAVRLLAVGRDFPKPEASVALDSNRVEVPEGRWRLSLRWFLDYATVGFENERDVVYLAE